MIADIPKKITNAGTNHQPMVIHKNPKRNSKGPIFTCGLIIFYTTKCIE